MGMTSKNYIAWDKKTQCPVIVLRKGEGSLEVVRAYVEAEEGKGKRILPKEGAKKYVAPQQDFVTNFVDEIKWHKSRVKILTMLLEALTVKLRRIKRRRKKSDSVSACSKKH